MIFTKMKLNSIEFIFPGEGDVQRSWRGSAGQGAARAGPFRLVRGTRRRGHEDGQIVEKFLAA